MAIDVLVAVTFPLSEASCRSFSTNLFVSECPGSRTWRRKSIPGVPSFFAAWHIRDVINPSTGSNHEFFLLLLVQLFGKMGGIKLLIYFVRLFWSYLNVFQVYNVVYFCMLHNSNWRVIKKNGVRSEIEGKTLTLFEFSVTISECIMTHSFYS